MEIDIRNSVLAMYDIRGKQEFIFRTNKLKEIVGGSWIIRDCFNDYLFDEAKQIDHPKDHPKDHSKDRPKDHPKDHSKDHSKGIFDYKDKNGKMIPGSDFTEEKYLQHLDEGYIGEVVYDGGGNFLLLLCDEATFKELTYRFTKRLMEEIGTLRVLGTCVRIDGSFSDYQKDNAELRARHRQHEMEESIIAPWSCLPIVQVDRATSQPLVYVAEKNRKDIGDNESDGVVEKHSKECFAKLRKFRTVVERSRRRDEAGLKPEASETVQRYFLQNQNLMDELVTEKGEDSQLAVVYIDGNSMGARVQNRLEEARQRKYGDNATQPLNYEDSVKELRRFSDEIQKTCVENGIESTLSALYEREGNDPEKSQGHRLVVYAGDEINFIVNAHAAWQCAKDYLLALPEGYSACAGIAVFHSHAPYAEAYRIAEECCESGKKLMKKKNITDASFVDFHICQGAMGIDLDHIRRDVVTLIGRPWLVKLGGAEKSSEVEDITSAEEIERLAGIFQRLGRSSVKKLASLAECGDVELSMDLLRIRAHQSPGKRDAMKEEWSWLGVGEEAGGKKVSGKMRRMIYDTVLAYDLWFSETETSGADWNDRKEDEQA